MASDKLADDLLYGAEDIGKFLGLNRRSVYYRASLRGRRRLPVFRMGGSGICARKSTLLDWIRSQETE
jgi:hypothetical protein